jgi:hypothetical protein
MEKDREYQRENYKVDHDLLAFYENILGARTRTAKALNQYKAVEKGIGAEDITQEIENKNEAKTYFLHLLDLFYDLVRFKFQKSDVEKPDFMEDDGDEDKTVHELDMEKGEKLYNKCCKLLEDLDITSLEDLDKGRRVI